MQHGISRPGKRVRGNTESVCLPETKASVILQMEMAGRAHCVPVTAFKIELANITTGADEDVCRPQNIVED